MINKNLLEKEIYKIDHEWKTIFYAPLTRNFDITDGDWILNNEWFKEATNLSEVPDFIKEKSFASLLSKIKIRLNITNKCSLNCEYCSVSSNWNNWIDMPDKIAFSSIDNLYEYAKFHNASEIELTFSWWEPTLRLAQIEKIIYYIEEKILWWNIKLVTKLLTNWVIPLNKIWIISSLFNGIQVSWDWFFENNNPRLWNKIKLQNKIWENIWLFVNSWVKVNILTVVSSYNYKNIEEIVDKIYNDYWIEDIVLSLIDWIWKGTNKTDLDFNLLRKNYINLWKKYRNKDIDIPLTWTDIHSISNHPCWISVPNFSVWPNWDISACTLTFNYQNEWIWDNYKIWQIKWEKLILDETKIIKLQSMNIISMNNCSNCFAKWHCRWWCRYANKEKWLWDISPLRCDLVKKIIADKILFIAWV